MKFPTRPQPGMEEASVCDKQAVRKGGPDRKAPGGLWRVIGWINVVLMLGTLACALSLGALVYIEHPTTKEVPYQVEQPALWNQYPGVASDRDPCAVKGGIYLVGVASGVPSINCTSGTRMIWDKPPSPLLMFLNTIITPLGMTMTAIATISLAMKWWQERNKDEATPP